MTTKRFEFIKNNLARFRAELDECNGEKRQEILDRLSEFLKTVVLAFIEDVYLYCKITSYQD